LKNPRTSQCCGDTPLHFPPELFRALSDPNRIAIFTHLVLAGFPQSVTDVTSCCSVDFSVVSRHLRILREAGAVTARKSGKKVLYSVRTGVLVGFLRSLADGLESCCPDGVYAFEDDRHE